MTTIFLKTIDQELQATRLPKLASNNQNSARVHVEFDATWDGYGKSAVFYTSENAKPYKKVLSPDGNCVIPPEVLAEEGTLYIGIEGAKGRNVKSSAMVAFKILAGTPTVVISDPTESQYQEIMSAYGETVKALAAEKLERKTADENAEAKSEQAIATEKRERVEADERAAAAIASEAAERAREIAVERARMDGFVKLKDGSTTGDAELQDVRVGVNGETYDSAGAAVRGQFNIEKRRIDGVLEGVVNPCGRQVLDFGLIVGSTSIDIYMGTATPSSEEYYAIDTFMVVERAKAHYLIFDQNTRTYIYFYDSNKQYLGYAYAEKSGELDEFPPNTVYIKIVFLRNSETDNLPTRNIKLLEGSDRTVSKLIIDDNSVTEEKCSFFVRNLLEYDRVEYNKVFNPEYGSPYEATDRSITGFFDVENVECITTNFKYYIAYYDEERVFISDIADKESHAEGTFYLPTHEKLKYARIIFLTTDSQLISSYYISNCDEPLSDKRVIRRGNLPPELFASWYKGKKISVFGDSITEGNKWQPFVEKMLGCTVVNCGIGGTTVANNGSTITYNGAEIDGYMCGDDRINLIPEDSDMIILFGGANDWAAASIEMGELGDGNLVDTTFKSAYSLMIKKIVNKFPNARLVSLTPINGRTSEANANEDMQFNVRGFSLYDFANAVKDVSAYYGVPCIDVHGEAGINTFNHTAYIADIVHPNDEGGKLLANAVINGLKRFEPIDFDE